MKAELFEPLKFRPFRSLFSAQLFSDLGNWLDFIALQVIVAYHWGLDETAIAAVIITLGLPWIVFGPLASVIVDRLPKKQLMIICLFLRIMFIGGMFLAPNLYILLIFVFLKATASAIYDPARQSMIRFTVPENYLPQAVTLSQLSGNSMKIIGPALGGGLIFLFGTKSPFLFEAAGFLIAILFLLTLPNRDEKEYIAENKKRDDEHYWKELLEGIKHISHTPLLKSSVILSSVAFFIIFLYDGLFVFIAQNLGFTKGNFGLLISAVGLGSVAGSLLIGFWTNWRRKPIHIMSGSFLVSGALIIFMALGSMEIIQLPRSAWVIGAFFLGFMGSGESVPYGYILQTETPKQLMGRVSAASTSLQTLSMLIAPALGSLLAKWIGISFVLLGAGGATCLLGTFILIFIVGKFTALNDIHEKRFQA
ncbi:MFS transporter [Peribacillus sp. SI8-4]|uniref:MFS transporter n=1 Tax=Peribacillus sp. SI8-4 TaxID=3048009 RepID=UPI0025543D04|nr:MFS transporter [Peribacillus sp. SI8-4]